MKKSISLFLFYLLFNSIILIFKEKNNFVNYIYSNLYIDQLNYFSISINIISFFTYFILFYLISFKLLRKSYPYFVKKKQLQFIYWLYNQSFPFLIRLISIYYKLRYYYHKLTYKTKLYILFHFKFKNCKPIYLSSYIDQYDGLYIDRREMTIPLVFEAYSGAILSSNHTEIKEKLSPFEPNNNKLKYQSLFQFISISVNGKFLMKITKFELIWSGFLDHTHDKKILHSFKNIKQLYDVHNQWIIYNKKQKEEYDLLDNFNSYLESWKKDLDIDIGIEQIIIRIIKGELDVTYLEELLENENHFFLFKNQPEIERVIIEYRQKKAYQTLEKYDFDFNKIKNKIIEFQKTQFEKIPDQINLTINLDDPKQFRHLIDFFKTFIYYLSNYNDEREYKIKNDLLEKRDDSIDRKLISLKRKLDDYKFFNYLEDRPSKYSDIPIFYCYNLLYFIFNLFYRYDQTYLKKRYQFYFVRCLTIELSICLQIMIFSLICLPILYYIPNFIYIVILYIYFITFKLLFQLKFKQFKKRMVRLFSFQIGYLLFYLVKTKLLIFLPLTFLYLFYYLFSFFIIILMMLLIEFKNILENQHEINFFFLLIERILLFLEYWSDIMKQSFLKIKEKLKKCDQFIKKNEKNWYNSRK